MTYDEHFECVRRWNFIVIRAGLGLTVPLVHLLLEVFFEAHDLLGLFFLRVSEPDAETAGGALHALRLVIVLVLERLGRQRVSQHGSKAVPDLSNSFGLRLEDVWSH